MADETKKTFPWGLIIFGIVLTIALIGGFFWWNNKQFFNMSDVDSNTDATKDKTIIPKPIEEEVTRG